ncbi:uncharacterized protein TNCV_514151, partial [Trichonephila clavipes]
MFKGAKKEDLRRIASELELCISNKLTVLDFMDLIKNCDRYKNDPDSVHELANLIIEERKYDESQQLELEKIREKSKLDLEIARIGANDKDNNTEVNCNDSSSLDSLIKRIRTLTVKIPDKPEGWSFFFLSLERAFAAKSVTDKFKPEILLNLLGEKAANIIIYLNDEDLKNYDKIKSIILQEFEPTPQSCLENFKKATRQNCESHVQFASRLTTNWEYYLKLRNVSNFEVLKQLIVSDKIFSTLDKETASHISVRQADKWFDPLTLGKEIDLFYSSRDSSEIKVLGVYWNPKHDCFSFRVKIDLHELNTKRDVLSTIARIYDPLGLLGPVVAKAKIFLQKLWMLKIDWTDLLPDTINREWRQFVESLQVVNDININRCIVVEQPEVIELHGFSDASQSAYGAVVYCKSITSDRKMLVHLIASKSRVAPTKPTTIPRLELCAAVLLAKLVHRVKQALKLNVTNTFLWSDSMIVLSWIRKESYQLKTFVANRIATIQEMISSKQWRYVATEDNPADFVSRGMDSLKLKTCELWWNGPKFLMSNQYPQRQIPVAVIKDPGRSITSIVEPDLTNLNENRLDNWQKITKIIQLIWKRWSVDYLNSLQQRNKWHFEKKNAKIGDMVIIKEDNLPSCQWSLGRINNIYQGKDSKVRVVEVKTTR